MPPMHQHEHEKAGRAQRAVRRDDGRKDFGFGESRRCRAHGAQYRGNMARKTTKQSLQPPARARRHAASGQGSRQSRGQGRPRPPMARCRNGQRPRSTKRSAASRPPIPSRAASWSTSIHSRCWSPSCSPRRRPMPASTRRRRLCSSSPTRPRRWSKLGEARVRDLIKTIGLYRTKAKNLIALSQKLVDEHGGKVPHDREALEALPGVGRKTANVVLNIAFGEPTIAVDTHIFRVGNRTGPCRRQDAARRRNEARWRSFPSATGCTPTTGSSCTAAMSASPAGRYAKNA